MATTASLVQEIKSGVHQPVALVLMVLSILEPHANMLLKENALRSSTPSGIMVNVCASTDLPRSDSNASAMVLKLALSAINAHTNPTPT